jgi:hypothetical protein
LKGQASAAASMTYAPPILAPQTVSRRRPQQGGGNKRERASENTKKNPLNAPVSAAASASYVLPALPPLNQPQTQVSYVSESRSWVISCAVCAHMIRVAAKIAMSKTLLQKSNDNFLLPPLDPNRWFCQPITHSPLRNGLEDLAHEEHNVSHDE